MLEKQLMRFVEDLRQKQPMPLRITLWNGSSTALSDAPRVELKLRQAGAAKYLLNPSLDRLGEAFVEGLVDVDGDIRDVIAVAEGLAQHGDTERGLGRLPGWLSRHTRKSDRKAIEYHYDVSNEFYSLWLDPQMLYSCAYFPQGDEDLATAQTLKLEHICRKLMISPGQTLLDIGCGWGALAIHAARHHGARVVGVTLSTNQYELARERVRQAGLEDRVEIRLQDYRDIPGDAVFDRISSVGMFEHVGLKNLPVYFHSIQRLLKEGGLVLNHGITTRDPAQQDGGPNTDSFIHQYVFPDGELPHVSRAALEMEQQHLEVQDVECLRPHYAQTLMHWVTRLEAQREQAIAMVGEKRYRIWRIYMAGCAHAFERGWVSIHQLLASKQTQPGLAPCPWTREYQYGSAPADGAQLAQPRWPDGSVAPRHREAIQPEQLAG